MFRPADRPGSARPAPQAGAFAPTSGRALPSSHGVDPAYKYSLIDPVLGDRSGAMSRISSDSANGLAAM